MAESSSTLPLGSPLPPITLTNAVDGQVIDVTAQAAGKRGPVLMFICNHCPFVVHIRKELAAAAHEAEEKGLTVFAINSNDVQTHPQDGPDAMARLAREEGFRFPFLFDETQDVARALRAQCTPDLYVFDAEGRLAYHGQFDDSRPSNGKPVTGRDLRSAIDAVAAGRPPVPEQQQRPGVGCSIKWRRGSGH
ncbi:MAG: thioredoxin family protein [Myxococcales bacterium]|nr:thioredoxin family protein [Myxococcales bacterium]